MQAADDALEQNRDNVLRPELEASIEIDEAKDIGLQEALNHLKQAVNQDPRNVELINRLGLAAESAGDRDRAMWAYRRAIRLQPYTAESYINLGRLYSKEGRNKSAIKTLQNGLKNSLDTDEQNKIYELLRALREDEFPEEKAEIGLKPGESTLNKAWENLNLTPAEALYLADPENSSGQQMLRYTLLDLAARGVLDVTDNYRVGGGEQYLDSEIQPHEAVFSKYFMHFDDYVDMQRLSRTVSAELKNRYELFKNEHVRQSLVEKGLLKIETRKILGIVPIQEYQLTSEGIRARNKANQLLKRTNNQVASTIKSNPDQADAYISQGGPSLLLLEEYPPGYFQEWQEKLVYMGFGPTIDQVRAKVPTSSGIAWLDDIVRIILSQ
jgi:hypothetical protein